MKVICITLLLVLGLNAYGQKLKYSRMDSVAYDLEYTKYNIGKFKKQLFLGYTISAIGTLSYIVSSSVMQPPLYDLTKASDADYTKKFYSDVETYQTNQKIIGGVCAVITGIGLIISLDSYSWLKRASIKPSQYGVSFTYDLDKEDDAPSRGYGE